MPDFSTRSTACEEMDLPDSDPQKLERTLTQFESINRVFSRVRPLLRCTVLADLRGRTSARLVDLGSGACDTALWLREEAEKRGCQLEVVAVDADERVVAFARERTKDVSGVRIVHGDVLDPEWYEGCDYAFGNHLLHHLIDCEVQRVLELADQHCQRGYVFSDLKRCRFAYAAFSIASRAYRKSFAREDGLLSIQRGFLQDELKQLGANCTCRVQPMLPCRYVVRGGVFSI